MVISSTSSQREVGERSGSLSRDSATADAHRLTWSRAVHDRHESVVDHLEITRDAEAPLKIVRYRIADAPLADHSHFTRVFSRAIGAGPGAWRRFQVQ
jgi:hypothetical protein